MNLRVSRRVRGRLVAATLGLALAAGVGAVVAPSPAFAIPEGGWCFSNWITGVTNHGQTFQALPGTTASFTNQTSQTATWTRSRTTTTTFTSTVSTTTTFMGGLDLGVIRIGVQSATTVTIVQTVTTSQTDSFSVPVPPGMTFFSAYGSWKLHTTFTYHQLRYGCVHQDFPVETAGQVTAHHIVSESGSAPGWRIWQ